MQASCLDQLTSIAAPWLAAPAVSCSQIEQSDGKHSLGVGATMTRPQQLQPVWQMKRRSALDRHAAFVRRLERQRRAREQISKENGKDKIDSAKRLRTFTKKLRHAILHNADVASTWQPAAHMMATKATLDKKLGDHSFASAIVQECQPRADPGLSAEMLKEMAQLVDTALIAAPASCSRDTSSGHVAALQLDATSQSMPADSEAAVLSASNGHIQESAEHEQTQQKGTGYEHSANAAAVQLKGTTDAQSLQDLSSSASARSIGSKKSNKPAWAMTADAALHAEQQEEDDLLAFAGGLEFDRYIDAQEDAELRTALQEMRATHDSGDDASRAALKKHVVRAINNLAGQDAPTAAAAPDAHSCGHKSEGGASAFSRATVASKAKEASVRAAALAGKTDTATKWDTSTKAGSDVGSMGRMEKDGCNDLFRENPEMKQVYSVASAAALLKRVAASAAVQV